MALKTLETSRYQYSHLTDEEETEAQKGKVPELGVEPRRSDCQAPALNYTQLHTNSDFTFYNPHIAGNLIHESWLSAPSAITH